MKKNFCILGLTRFELCLWSLSAAVVILGHLFSPDNGWLNLIASLVGVTSLIFIAKGAVLGQMLLVLFAVLYGIISLQFHYYGEMITYLGMSAPMAILAVIAWIRHPFPGTREVEIAVLTRRSIRILTVSTAAVTIAFYFILRALNTSNLLFSTISVSTSFVAAALTFLRSPYYALGYSANDAVLIILWILAALENSRYIVMVLCFLMFLANDLYGFISWRRMQKRQKGLADPAAVQASVSFFQ